MHLGSRANGMSSALGRLRKHSRSSSSSKVKERFLSVLFLF
jgi:hypothetical protein